MKKFRKQILGSAKKRAELADWIEEHSTPVIISLIQLYLFPSSEYENHWRQEVWSNFHEMKLLSSTKKLPSSDFILTNLWKYDEKYISSLIEYVLDKESTLVPRDNIDINVVRLSVFNYFKWISDQLSRNRVVKPSDVYKKLDDLNL